MSHKSDFLDYDPLGNPRLSKTVPEDDRGFGKRAAESERPEETFSVPVRQPFPKQEGQAVGAANAVTSVPAGVSQSVSIRTSERPRIVPGGHVLSFAGLFFFTFLVFFRPYEFSPALEWLSRGALITAIITIIIFVPTQLALENRVSIRPWVVNLVLILLLLSFVSVPLATDKAIAWFSFVDYLKVIIMFIVMVNVVRTEKRLKAIIFLVLIASCLLGVAAVNDYRAGNLALGGKRIVGVIGGLFDNPNDLALHLVTFFPIVVALLIGTRNPILRLFYFVSALIVLAGTVVTFSRGGFLGLIFVVGSLTWNLAQKNKLLVGTGLLVLIIVFLVLAPGAYRQRISMTGDASADARAGELKRSVYIALRHPLFGVGIGNFVVYSDTEHATHNAYTQVASETGIPAAVVYLLFLIAALKSVRRIPKPRDVRKEERRLAYLAIGIQASIVGYMVTSFFASVAYLWYIYYIAAYAICLSRICGSILPKHSEESLTAEGKVSPV